LVALSAAFTLAGCAFFNEEAIAVLRDIEAGPRPSALKASTPPPVRQPLRDGDLVADLYVPGEPIAAALVLTPGLSPDGKDDRRLVALAESFARARFLTLVPEIPGARAMRFSPADAKRIGAAIATLDRAATARRAPPRLGVAAISYAVAPALIAAVDHDPGDAVDFAIGLGGYYDARAVLAFVTTGQVRDPRTGFWTPGDAHPLGRWFLAQSLAAEIEDPADKAALSAYAAAGLADPGRPPPPPTGLGPEGRAVAALLTNTDPRRVDTLIAAAPPRIRRGVDALSLKGRDLSRLRGELILIHGEKDRVTPPSESRALADAVPETALFIAPGFSHIEIRSVGLDGKRVLAEAMAEVLKRRDGR